MNIEIPHRNSIEICNKHLQLYFTDEKYELLNLFKETINDDICMLEYYHIDMCNTLLIFSILCKKCMESFAKPKILYKECSSSGLSQFHLKIVIGLVIWLNSLKFTNCA